MRSNHLLLLWSLSLIFLSGCFPPAQKLTAQDLAIHRKETKSLVVVHSRGGSTARMALALANTLQTDYIRLVVPESAGSCFFSTPNRVSPVIFKPARVDLGRYNLLFLGSPIWFWHPTAFIYSFINKHDLTNKKVVLFYTYKGGMGCHAIEDWKHLVASRGGEVVDVIGINRKKLKKDKVREATMKIIRERRKLWPVAR